MALGKVQTSNSYPRMKKGWECCKSVGFISFDLCYRKVVIFANIPILNIVKAQQEI
jgi:hypothetical protein